MQNANTFYLKHFIDVIARSVILSQSEAYANNVTSAAKYPLPQS